jgi:hypothetical protein
MIVGEHGDVAHDDGSAGLLDCQRDRHGRARLRYLSSGFPSGQRRRPEAGVERRHDSGRDENGLSLLSHASRTSMACLIYFTPQSRLRGFSQLTPKSPSREAGARAPAVLSDRPS